MSRSDLCSAFVGRQPIYNADLQVFAYELLFRCSDVNKAEFVDGDEATAEVILNSFAEIGLDRITGALPAFINVPRNFLLERHAFSLPKERVVLEVLEDVDPEPDILAAMRELRESGYSIAIDDFVYRPELMPMVELADIVKVELPAVSPEELAEHVAILREKNVSILAEKVETHEQFDRCTKLGFNFFQGFFFCKPKVIQGQKIPVNKIAVLRLITRLQSDSVCTEDIVEAVRTEPSLSYKILRFVNSSYCALSTKVESIRHAVTLAGMRRIRTFCSLSLLTKAMSRESLLADRLTGRLVDLSGINVSESETLMRLRLGGSEIPLADAERVLREACLGEVVDRRWGGSAAPREVLRHAAAVWDRLAASGGEGGTASGGSAGGESVRDYLPPKEHLPDAASLAEPATLRPMNEVVRAADKPAGEPQEPEKVDPGTIKQMGNISSLLRELKSRREQFVPGRQEADVGEAPLVPQTDETDVADDEASPLMRRFNELRDPLLKKGGQHLDLEALRRMVSLAGESFPVVDSSEFKMSPGEEPMVMRWAFPGNEILFGFEPEHQFRYWQSLIKLAARRAESAAAGRLKLVVFCDREKPFSGVASADEEELEAAREKYLDVIELDAGTIASVAAADRVVFEMAKADAPVVPADTIRELAPQLDPLWRRITRPLIEAGEGERV